MKMRNEDEHREVLQAALSEFSCCLRFYPGAGRSELLAEAGQFVQFSVPPLMLVSDDGEEREAFVAELSRSGRPDDIACLVDIESDTSAEDLLLCIARQLSVNVRLDGSIDELIGVLADALSDKPSGLFIIICQFNSAEVGAVMPLLALHERLLTEQGEQGCKFRLVLSGSSSVLGLVEVPTDAHRIELAPLNNSEIDEYLVRTLHAAGVDASSAYFREFRKGFLNGGAYLSVVRQLARKMLEFSLSIEPTPDQPPPAASSARERLNALMGRYLPWGHALSLVVLLTGLLMLMFYRHLLQPAGDVSEESQRALSRVSESAPLFESADRPVADERISSPSVTHNDAAEAATIDNGALAPSGGASEGNVDEVPAAVGLSLEPGEERFANEEESAQPIAITAIEQGEEEVSQYTSDERALLALSEDHYVLQVMAASNRKQLDDFLSRQPNNTSLHSYQAVRNGALRFVVVEGDYANSVLAKAAIARLPKVQQKAGPWPRKLSAIQGEIKENSRK